MGADTRRVTQHSTDEEVNRGRGTLKTRGKTGNIDKEETRGRRERGRR